MGPMGWLNLPAAFGGGERGGVGQSPTALSPAPESEQATAPPAAHSKPPAHHKLLDDRALAAFGARF